MKLKEIQKQVSLIKINNTENVYTALTLSKMALREIEILELPSDLKMKIIEELAKVPSLVDQYNHLCGSDFSIGDPYLFVDIVNTICDTIESIENA